VIKISARISKTACKRNNEWRIGKKLREGNFEREQRKKAMSVNGMMYELE
jgi:hypothetical protein